MFSCIHVNLITFSRANPNVFQEIPKDKLLPEAQKVETVLATKGPQGETIATRVHEVKDKTIVVISKSAGRQDSELRRKD